jgi:hypothetical protein
MELKTIAAIFDINEHTGILEDKLITEHISQLKKEGFRSCSNTLIKIDKENLHNHKTDMFSQVIVMARGAPGEQMEQPVYTRH